MFELAEVGHRLTKEEYKAAEAEIRPALIELQQELRARKDLAVVILVAGVEGAGKSETVNFLTSWLDPRGVEVNAFGPPSEEELERPRFWRFWRALPPKGKIGIFFGSWYSEPIVDRVMGRSKGSEFARRLLEIDAFESHLNAEGVLLLKFWMHLSRKEQKARHKRLSQDPNQSWHLSLLDKRYFKSYDGFYRVSEEAVQASNTLSAAWHVVEAVDDRYREITVARAVLDAVRERLGRVHGGQKPAPMPVPAKAPRTVLDALPDGKPLGKKAYEKRMGELTAEINGLTLDAFRRGISSVLVFEGWDAAGKGGSIRRLGAALDARYFRVVPISAPTEEERAQPYLWRFWRHLPRDGRVVVFDRSWYGRVMVERVEGFCHKGDWMRAYNEINDFEAQLVGSECVLLKYWLNITPEEQLRRFEERKVVDYKRFKITEEDWRNREKWNAYLVAVDEMVQRTNTLTAPWTLVDANDKFAARVRVLAAYRDALRKAMKRTRRPKKSLQEMKLG